VRVEDLRNYGKGLKDSTPDAQGAKKMMQSRKVLRSELRKELGWFGRLRLIGRTKRDVKEARLMDWAVLKQHGLTDQSVIDGIVQRIALMKNLVSLVGMERATQIQCSLLDKTMYDLMMPLMPTIDDYRACGDFFEAFKAYDKASYEANVRAGLHRMEIVEDTPKVLAFNITYCAWHEVAKDLGDPYLCYPSTCYGDEAYVPRALAGSGCTFSRSGTLATGAPVCDFRFEYVDTTAS